MDLTVKTRARRARGVSTCCSSARARCKIPPLATTCLVATQFAAVWSALATCAAVDLQGGIIFAAILTAVLSFALAFALAGDGLSNVRLCLAGVRTWTRIGIAEQSFSAKLQLLCSAGVLASVYVDTNSLQLPATVTWCALLRA